MYPVVSLGGWAVKEQITEPEQLARKFHEVYERLAPDHGYETREASAVSWDKVPENNKQLMIATAAELLGYFPPPAIHTVVGMEYGDPRTDRETTEPPVPVCWQHGPDCAYSLQSAAEQSTFLHLAEAHSSLSARLEEAEKLLRAVLEDADYSTVQDIETFLSHPERTV